MKGFSQLPTFSVGVPVLFVKSTILPRIVWFGCRGHRLRSLHTGCSSTSISMLLGSTVKYESITSSLDLLCPCPAFLSAGILAFLEASVLSAQISVTRIKSAAFLKALARVVSFCSAKENLNHPLFRSFRKEVYATPSSKSGIKTTS